MEHLSKIKKEGKTVGYSEWTEGGWVYFNDLEPENKFTHFMVPQKGLTDHRFVAKDRNGEKVFVGDLCLLHCYEPAKIVYPKWNHKYMRYELFERATDIVVMAPIQDTFERHIELIEES